jgi:hypothetical protein
MWSKLKELNVQRLKRNGHGNLRGEINSIRDKSENNLKFKGPIKEQIK